MVQVNGGIAILEDIVFGTGWNVASDAATSGASTALTSAGSHFTTAMGACVAIHPLIPAGAVATYNSAGSMTLSVASTGSVVGPVTFIPCPYDLAHTRINVGDGNGMVPTVAATDTALVASSNKLAKNCNAAGGSITRSAQTETIVAVLQSGDANFAINEWAWDNGNSGGPGTFLNHRGVALGTKVSGAVWTVSTSDSQS